MEYTATRKGGGDMNDAYRAAIARMLKNIHDERLLRLVYRYVLYIYTRLL